MSDHHVITFQPVGVRVIVARNSTILDAILRMGLEVSHTCGGHSTCGSCLVHVEEGRKALSPVQIDEMGHLMGARSRLACQSKIRGDVTVRLPISPPDT